MTTIALSIPLFRATCPAFSNATAYPDAAITNWWSIAVSYVSDDTYGRMTEGARALCLNYMTAHLMFLNDHILAGKPIQGIVEQAVIDKIHITLKTAPATSQWRWWLNLSPHGAMLVSMLEMQSVGGFFIGGSPEQSAFRKVGGYF